MTYPDLFKSRYPSLKGRDWIRTIDPDDLKAFVMIGFRESDFGKRGGKALYQKKGNEYFREIGRRGALVSNLKRWIAKQIEIETYKELSL